MDNNQRQYNSRVSRQTRVTSGMWLKLTSLLSVVKVSSAESQMEPCILLPISELMKRYARYCDDCNLSMQMKLNGVIFTNMINNILSFVQVQHHGQLRIQDHVYIDLMKRHTKRLTTSIFAGRAAHGYKAEWFNIRRVVFELFTPHNVGLTSSKLSSIYRENIVTRISDVIVKFSRVCDGRLMLKHSSLQCDDQSLRRYYCIDDVLAR